LALTHPWSASTVLRRHIGLAAGGAYVEGAIDFQGDAIALMHQFSAIASARFTWRDWLALLALRRRLARPPQNSHPRRARLSGKMHSKDRDRAAIEFHYDLPQSFYEQFLDANLVYSCAYFSDVDEDLQSAQIRKLDLICRKLQLRPGARFLDVGCGWASLLIHAARHYGVQGVGATLSQTQFRAGRDRVERSGLADRIEIRLQDYRDVQGTYDAIASVGMLEHVGPAQLPSYVRQLRRSLAAGGLMLNHGVVLNDAERVRRGDEPTFLTRYVFPDGGIAAAWRLVEACERGGLVLLDVEQLGQHKALTLRHWLANLERNHRNVVEIASEEDYRIWRAYMAMSAFGFEAEELGVVQVLAAAPGRSRTLPLGRTWMGPNHVETASNGRPAREPGRAGT
jgi:cyclopropane-fatty-acyl-phospholipid synthase